MSRSAYHHLSIRISGILFAGRNKGVDSAVRYGLSAIRLKSFRRRGRILLPELRAGQWRPTGMARRADVLLCLAALAVAAPAQVAPPPFFEARGVLGGGRQIPLAPGQIRSVYGKNLGPAVGCTGEADPQRRETPNPLRPKQTDLETRIYPIVLCETQVFLAGIPAGLLYVQAGQINFQVPQEIPIQGTIEMRVAYSGQSSAPVALPAGIPTTAISLESPARVGMPIWLKVTLPDDPNGDSIQYPFLIWPAAFGCNQVEVRRDGMLLPRIADLRSQAFDGIVFAGAPCGSLGLSSERRIKGRLPLDLQYRFDRPGIYEVRFTRRTDWNRGEVVASTDWTPIEVLPEDAGERQRWLADQRAHPPPNTADLLSDFLPGILASPDEQSLDILREYLYHPDSVVRHYAMYGLTYWPPQAATESVWELVREKGPSDAAVEFLTHQREFQTSHADPLVAAALPYLQSDSAVTMQGAVQVLHWAFGKDSPVSGPVRVRSAEALGQSAEHLIETDPKNLNEYASVLGMLNDPASHELLWDLVKRGLAAEQAMIALSWRKDPADLPKLAALVLDPGNGADSRLASLPYALDTAYGDAAIPYLEQILAGSEALPLRTGSARELMGAGRSSGFAFAADAMEKGRPYSRELADFVRGRFREMGKADDAAVLKFLRQRAAAQ
jgi:hypothetical protein